MILATAMGILGPIIILYLAIKIFKSKPLELDGVIEDYFKGELNENQNY